MLRKAISPFSDQGPTSNGDTDGFNFAFIADPLSQPDNSPVQGATSDAALGMEMYGDRFGSSSPVDFAMEAEAAKNSKPSGGGTTTSPSGTTPIQDFKQFWTTSDLPTDSLFNQQWNLHNTGQSGGTAGVDINILPVWHLGYTGKGVAVGVFDTAMDVNHIDLASNIDMSKTIIAPDGSYVDPTQVAASGDEHATSVAGIIAAARNGSDVVGIAYDAKITPVDILTDNTTGSSYGWEALWSQNQFDVTNNSWGFSGAFVLSALDSSTQYWVLQGFDIGADTGRNGLGTIENLAATNYRQNGFSTELTGVTVDRHAIVVGATDNHGYVASYSDPGASLLVVAPGNAITTDDITGSLGYSTGDYTSGFSGTSAATPELSGIEADMLQANPDLGWRDVQDILSLTARHTGSAIGGGVTGYESDPWAFNGAHNWNGGGTHFSNDYGFGIVDAFAAVELAKTWDITFPTAHTSTNELLASSSLTGSWDIGHAHVNTMTFSIDQHMSVEDMTLDLTDLTDSAANHLAVDLISPTGTVSHLLADQGGTGASITAGWELMSHEFRGEDAFGTWTVKFVDSTSTDVATMSQMTLTAYGAPIADDSVFIYTDEFSQYYSAARGTLSYSAGPATIDAAPTTGGMNLNLLSGQGTIDQKALTITAGTNVTTVITGDGDSTVTGNNLGDKLVGGLGNDTLVGGTGADHLDGNLGTNALTGGSGADSFGLHTTGLDNITDFLSGTDKLTVAATEFGGNIATSGVTSADFLVGSASNTHVAGGGFVYDTSLSNLYYDATGTGPLQEIAHFTNSAHLTTQDFIVA